MTPSAKALAAAACSGVAIPTPTSRGRSVCGRTAATTSRAVAESWSRAPVTPYVATQ